MITKNAVILVGQIEAERAAGQSVFDAALDAGATRFRPIMLTALSTVFGMIPIAPTVFWGPMAFAIMGGLLAGTLLTLVFLPALYVAWYGEAGRVRRPRHRRRRYGLKLGGGRTWCDRSTDWRGCWPLAACRRPGLRRAGGGRQRRTRENAD